MRFFVAYVDLDRDGRKTRAIHPRIFYKDVSMTWRSASHMVRSENDNWLGKGDLKPVVENGEERYYTDEATTDLPLELQTALETVSRSATRLRYDVEALYLVLRRAPDDRTEPYSEFTRPRRAAAATPANLVNRGRSVAHFARHNDPTSLRFARGYEPDFRTGIVERSHSHSQLYGGRLRRFRILSSNREIQYFFIAGPRLVWICSCQTTSTQLSSFGVRTLDVPLDDKLLIPAYEYHFIDDDLDPPELHSQIPTGFAGAPHRRDPYRADASPWLDEMPVIREFRRVVLKQRSRVAERSPLG
jgi:hypothetical protein